MWRLERRAREVEASAGELVLELGTLSKPEEESININVKVRPILKKEKDKENFWSRSKDCLLMNELGS